MFGSRIFTKCRLWSNNSHTYLEVTALFILVHTILRYRMDVSGNFHCDLICGVFPFKKNYRYCLICCLKFNVINHTESTNNVFGLKSHLSSIQNRENGVSFQHFFPRCPQVLCMFCSTMCLVSGPLCCEGAKLRCGSELLNDLLFVCGDRGLYLGTCAFMIDVA